MGRKSCIAGSDWTKEAGSECVDGSDWTKGCFGLQDGGYVGLKDGDASAPLTGVLVSITTDTSFVVNFQTTESFDRSFL